MRPTAAKIPPPPGWPQGWGHPHFNPPCKSAPGASVAHGSRRAFRIVSPGRPHSLSLSLSLPPSPSSSSSFPLPISVLPWQPLRVGRLRLGQALREHAAGRVHEGRRLLLHRLPTCVLLLPVRGRHVERLVSQGAGQAARRLPHEHDMYNMPSAHHRHIRHMRATKRDIDACYTALRCGQLAFVRGVWCVCMMHGECAVGKEASVQRLGVWRLSR